VEFSDLEEFMDTPIKNYSSGMHATLGFALAVQLKPDVLLVDEVLAVGDEPFQEKCKKQIDKFRVQGKTIGFVSHSADDVRNICDRARVLDHGRLVFVGEPPMALERYHQLLAS
jgi:ABC-type polysaccharide/polyol phosphate transport system ATPase subunit